MSSAKRYQQYLEEGFDELEASRLAWKDAGCPGLDIKGRKFRSKEQLDALITPEGISNTQRLLFNVAYMVNNLKLIEPELLEKYNKTNGRNLEDDKV